MMFTIKQNDEDILKYGLEKRAKLLAGAVTASLTCGMAMLPQTTEEAVTKSALRVVEELAKRERGFTGVISVTDAIGAALQNAAYIYLGDADKLAEKTVGMKASAAGIQLKMEEARFLHDRMTGKLDLFDDANYNPADVITHVRLGEKGGVEFCDTSAGGTDGDWTTYEGGKPVVAPMPTLDELSAQQEAEAKGAPAKGKAK